MRRTDIVIRPESRTPGAGHIRCHAPASPPTLGGKGGPASRWLAGGLLAAGLLAGAATAAFCDGAGKPAPAPRPPDLPAPTPSAVGRGPVQGPPLPPTPGRPYVEGPLSIGQAVGTALANAPSLGTARADVAAAQARIGGARAMTLPSVSANTFATTGTMGSILQSPPVVGGPQNTLGVPPGTFLDQNFMAMVPLYTGGRLRSEVRAAAANRGASEQGLLATTRDVTLATREAYWTALFAGANVAVFHDAMVLQQESLRIAEERLRVGKAPRLDVLRRRTEAANATQQLANAMRDADLAMVALKTTMGVSLASPVTLTDRLTFAPVGGTLDEYMAAAQRNRAEIAAAAERVRAAEAMIASARGNYRPQVYGAGMVDLSTGSRMGSASGYTLGVVASLPLLDAGLRKSQVGTAEAERERMRQDAANVQLTVARDVSDAWFMLRTAAGNVETARTAVAEAEEGYRVMVQRYEAGRATTVEVLDALAALTRARVNELQAVYEHSVARDRLERAAAAPAAAGTPAPAQPIPPPSRLPPSPEEGTK